MQNPAPGPWAFLQGRLGRVWGGGCSGAPQRALTAGTLVLRAWGVWRARRNNWCRERPGRQREEQAMLSDLEADIRAFPAPLAEPLLGLAKAHSDLEAWVPDLVHRLLH